jgi:energy-coupling factor transporter transmembrane protein EcfT
VGAVVVLKAAAAGLAAILLTLTTPYPQVFAPVQAIVPGIVGDALLMTYRTFFLLLARFSEMMTAVRLRSASRSGGVRRSVRDTAAALGNVILYSFDLAQHDYDVLYVRGYSGKLRASSIAGTPGARDPLLGLAAVLVLAAAIAVRVRPEQLGAYSWLALIPAVAALATSLIRRRTA